MSACGCCSGKSIHINSSFFGARRHDDSSDGATAIERFGFDGLQFSATKSAAGLKAPSYKVPLARRMKGSNQAIADAFSRARMGNSFLAIKCRMSVSYASVEGAAARNGAGSSTPCL